MIVESIPVVEILDYEKQMGLSLIVKEQVNVWQGGTEYVAHFEGMMVEDGMCIRSTCGWGSDADSAIEDHIRNISLKTAWFFDGRKFLVPKLIHTRKLNK